VILILARNVELYLHSIGRRLTSKVPLTRSDCAGFCHDSTGQEFYLRHSMRAPPVNLLPANHCGAVYPAASIAKTMPADDRRLPQLASISRPLVMLNLALG
jgi:hypothetical protein